MEARIEAGMDIMDTYGGYKGMQTHGRLGDSQLGYSCTVTQAGRLRGS